MKIFGAVLIVSGGFLFGKVMSNQWEQCLSATDTLLTLFMDFDRKLRENRVTPEEFFAQQGELGEAILGNRPIAGLTQNDQEKLAQHLMSLRGSSFIESVKANEEFLKYLISTVDQLKERTNTSGKAVPLVSGAAGLLVAVMLF